MTAASRLSRVELGTSVEDGFAIAAASCPTDPHEMIAGLRWALHRAMRGRADGSRHLDSCRNARVNAINDYRLVREAS